MMDDGWRNLIRGKHFTDVSVLLLRLRRFSLWFIIVAPIIYHPSSSIISAAELPSLFRGVVVADSAAGVRVVSVEESSQAYLGDLRPEDLIVRVRDAEVHTIDEFAALSTALKGRAASATVLIFRNGAPRELTLTLYSYPVQRAWNLEFIPRHDIRFAEPQTGLAYWMRLGEGFDRAGKPREALDAYLNGLHNVPDDTVAAVTVSDALVRVSRGHLATGELSDGMAQLHQALLVLNGLFTRPLSTGQLASVKRQLTEALQALREAKRHLPAA